MLHEWVEAYTRQPKPQMAVVGDEESHAEEELLTSIAANAPPHEITTWVFEPYTFSPVAKLQGEEQYSIVSDYLGTPTGMFSTSGEKVWSADTSIYGKLRNFTGSSLTDCPFRYPGQYEDEETGLYYNRFRYYDPEEGLYVSQDPIGLAGGNPTLYGYVEDVNGLIDVFGLNPILFTSSDGLTLQVSGYTDLSHMEVDELKSLYHANNNALNGKGYGLSPIDKQKNTIVLHHYKQNSKGPIVAMPAKHHDKAHTNPGQHPFGKKGGGGLTKSERAMFNKWKQEFWKSRAEEELKKKGKNVSCSS